MTDQQHAPEFAATKYMIRGGLALDENDELWGLKEGGDAGKAEDWYHIPVSQVYAAPELHEALKSLRWGNLNLIPDDQIPDDHRCELWVEGRELKAIRAALAKAS